MIKRPILVAVIGYVIGILMGLYFNFSIVLLYIPVTVIYIVITNSKYKQTKRDFKLISFHRYFRYIKLILNKKVVLIILISSIISNSIIFIQNKKYNYLYEDKQSLYLNGIIVSNKEEKEYKDIYLLKVKQCNKSKKYNNTYLYLNINKKIGKTFDYGDEVVLQGDFVEPISQRNEGGFDYKQYLKTLKIYGSVDITEIELKKSNQANILFTVSNKISSKLKRNIDEILNKEEASILKGLLFGDISDIEKETYEKFQISNMSHILAVSGMHISYIIVGINLLLKNKVGKRNTKYILIVTLIFYMFISGFSPSIVRATIMGILVILSGIVYRKNDIWTSIAFSLFIILIYNPFLITNIGLQLSYIGTIGIIILNKITFEILEKIKVKSKNNKYKFNKKWIFLKEKIKEILSITFSAQFAILPIILYHFNFVGIYFWITNLIVSIIIGPIIFVGIIVTILSIIYMPMAKKVSFILEIFIKFLVQISSFSELPFAKIYIPTPKVWMIILYYLIFIIFKLVYSIYHKSKINMTERRFRNLIELMKYKWKQKKEMQYKKILLIVILVFIIFQIIPKNLKIYFVDVGQGDCTFIVTPRNKTILIDGGGSEFGEFDVGKRTLLPYILDKGYKKIDYIIISHFDQDHVRFYTTNYRKLESWANNYWKTV